MKKPIIDPCGHCLTKAMCNRERELFCEAKESYQQKLFNYKILKADIVQYYCFSIILAMLVLLALVKD